MTDNDDDKYFDIILNLLVLIRKSIDDLGTAYRCAGQILRSAEHISDADSKEQIKTEARKILSSTSPQDIKNSCDSIQLIIETFRNSKKELVVTKDIRTVRFMDPKTITKTKRYMDDCLTYESQGDIPATEIKIQTYSQSEHLHGLVTSRTWKGYRHARLTYNLRIMYHWYEDERHLVYERIITKNEFDK